MTDAERWIGPIAIPQSPGRTSGYFTFTDDPSLAKYQWPFFAIADAMRAAAQAAGYTMWGLVPFLRLKQQQRQMPLEPLFMRDQLLKSVMVTIVVSAQKVPGVNSAGARSLQQYLVEPATQAKIRTFQMSGVAEPVWWPAAHDNENALLTRP